MYHLADKKAARWVAPWAPSLAGWTAAMWVAWKVALWASSLAERRVGKWDDGKVVRWAAPLADWSDGTRVVLSADPMARLTVVSMDVTKAEQWVFC